MQLWPHQLHAIETARVLHQRTQSKLLVQFPCGTGKSKVAVCVALAYVQRRAFARALVVAPNAQVMAQLYTQLRAATRLPVAIEQGARHAPPAALIVVGTVQSIWQRLPKYGRETLLIFDECHHGNLDAQENLKLAERFDHVVGLDATPWSRGCEQLFSSSARVVLPLEVAQRQQLVAPLALHDWTEPHGPLGLVFCSSNREAAERAGKHPGASWVGVDSGEVAERIAAWRARRIAVLYANRMMTEGVDAPDCGAVWIAKETESEILRVQMVGRAMRYRPGKVAAAYCASAEVAQGIREALERCNQPRLTAV